MKFLKTTQVKGLGSLFLPYNTKRYYIKNKLQQILNLFNISFKINNHFFEFPSKLKKLSRKTTRNFFGEERKKNEIQKSTYITLYHAGGRRWRAGDFRGENSKLHDLWLEHFECGIWVGDYVEADKMKYTDELTVSNSRIRNNFADGVNFAQGTRNSKVQNSNVRGNGDDGLAIWSSSKWDKEKNKDYLNKY